MVRSMVPAVTTQPLGSLDSLSGDAVGDAALE
jgi:hypothetical protein